MPDDDLPPPPPQADWQSETTYDQTYDANYGVGYSAGQPKCRVLFEYEAQRDDELNLQPGEIVTILREDEGWWEGELNGAVGMFPSVSQSRLLQFTGWFLIFPLFPEFRREDLVNI